MYIRGLKKFEIKQNVVYNNDIIIWYDQKKGHRKGE